jgi:hypothetical protein
VDYTDPSEANTVQNIQQLLPESNLPYGNSKSDGTAETRLQTACAAAALPHAKQPVSKRPLERKVKPVMDADVVVSSAIERLAATSRALDSDSDVEDGES